ncbi:MAG TPA: ABC transporter ATP-binding protein [Solirubrobacteraceae bacterium]|jgi:ABC-type sulfate/molybdate transport systems ATPase subunit|nr:ABC transporter ATP-binding protein [Solirubrobacteraceae bacterium]
MPELLLRCEHLTVRRAKRDVVRDVSVELRRGEVVALLGPNGAGKSTLLDALGGALAPVEGEIERHGRVAIALQAPDLARRSVLANVTLALAWWGVPRRERAARAREALATMGAAHLARRRADTLSGGERRRVHLARALAVAPDILLLDEPFAGLDAETRANLLEDAVSAFRSQERATLVVVHDRAEAWALADRLLVLIEGQLVAAGPPREVLEHPPNVTVARFLGYDGWLQDGGEALLTRPAHVAIDPDGTTRARVTRAVPLEDGVRLELELEQEHGRLYGVAPLPAPQVGATVRVTISGGVRFPLGADPSTSQRSEASASLDR